MNAEPAGRSLTVITSDNVAGAETAIQKLVELGHRRIGYVQGPTAVHGDRRPGGRVSACLRRGGARPRGDPVVAGDGLYEGGFTAGERRSTAGASA